MTTYWTGRGTSLNLGKLLGKGGEGSVYEVPSSSTQVAKLYHSSPEPHKQDKLRYMVAHAHADLLSYSAWPTETLHEAPGGRVVGFLMGRVENKQPVHMLYSPAHRKQEYPSAGWNLLLFAARNTAAAFETIHRHGHVLGDVNQGNVMVGADSKVLLIDSDSMQITADGQKHLCEVGVSHFTPPELQGISSFSTVARTSNHDAFGLALLIFHLLFGGRHPYAGRPLREDVGNALEADIKAFRFAYGADARQRGFEAPPRSISLSLLPAPVQTMFQRAFTEPGAVPMGRPSATQWVSALDQVRSTLKTCGKSKVHIYPGHATSCPWCALEGQGALFFVDLASYVAPANTGFVFARVWALVESTQLPPLPAVPTPSSFFPTATPIPESLRKRKSRAPSFVVIALVTAVFIHLTPAAGAVGGLLLLALWLTVTSGETEEYKREIARRSARFEAAQKSYDQLAAALRQANTSVKFSHERNHLNALRQSYQNLPVAEHNAIEAARLKARDRQLHSYLDRWFIDDATIPGLGPAKKTALQAWGIETAADITQASVEAVRGFGPKLTQLLLAWRHSCEARFRFDSSPKALQADIDKARSEVAVQRQKLELEMQGGLERLARIRAEVDAQVKRLLAQTKTAASELAQATADLVPA